jgi:hypothetical protein
MQVAAWCIQHLAEDSAETRDALRENGTLPHLVAIIAGDCPASARERAAWAICNLAARCPANRAALRCSSRPLLLPSF